jgi:hypothetical protein
MIVAQVKTRAAVSPIVSVPGTQMKLKSLRCAFLSINIHAVSPELYNVEPM